MIEYKLRLAKAKLQPFRSLRCPMFFQGINSQCGKCNRATACCASSFPSASTSREGIACSLRHGRCRYHTDLRLFLADRCIQKLGLCSLDAREMTRHQDRKNGCRRAMLLATRQPKEPAAHNATPRIVLCALISHNSCQIPLNRWITEQEITFNPCNFVAEEDLPSAKRRRPIINMTSIASGASPALSLPSQFL